TRGQDHSARGSRRESLAGANVVRADGAASLHDDARDLRLYLDRQTIARQRWIEIGGCRAVTPPITDRHLHAADAVLLRCVVIVVVGIAGLDGCFGIRIDKRIFVFGLARRERAVSAPIEALAALPGFLPPEVRQHV